MINMHSGAAAAPSDTDNTNTLMLRRSERLQTGLMDVWAFFNEIIINGDTETTEQNNYVSSNSIMLPCKKSRTVKHANSPHHHPQNPQQQ